MKPFGQWFADAGKDVVPVIEPDEDEGLDQYGNPLDGSSLPNCCFPDCGCDGARLCMAENGASSGACRINIERGSL